MWVFLTVLLLRCWIRFSPFLFSSLFPFMPTAIPLWLFSCHMRPVMIWVRYSYNTQTLKEYSSDCSVVTSLSSVLNQCWSYWVLLITEYSELGGTHKKHPVQLLNKWPLQGSTPRPWLLASCSHQLSYRNIFRYIKIDKLIADIYKKLLITQGWMFSSHKYLPLVLLKMNLRTCVIPTFASLIFLYFLKAVVW